MSGLLKGLYLFLVHRQNGSPHILHRLAETRAQQLEVRLHPAYKDAGGVIDIFNLAYIHLREYEIL